MGFSSSSRSAPLPSLPTHIEDLAKLELNEAVQRIVLLVPKISTHLSLLGQRYVTHPCYNGTAPLNRLAQIFMNLGWGCGRENASLETRLAHYDLYPSFQALYKTSEEQLKSSKASNFCNGFREFSLVCAHCVGTPSVTIPEGGRRGQPLKFEEKLFEELFGEQENTGSTSWWEAGQIKRLRGARREWVEDALKRENIEDRKEEEQPEAV